jgi:hypothetical protein
MVLSSGLRAEFSGKREFSLLRPETFANFPPKKFERPSLETATEERTPQLAGFSPLVREHSASGEWKMTTSRMPASTISSCLETKLWRRRLQIGQPAVSGGLSYEAGPKRFGKFQ